MPTTVPTSIRVVQGVAAREGVDPIDLEPPLHAVVDTDALDTLCRSVDDRSRTPVAVEFSYHGHRVHIDDSGEIEISADVSTAGSTAGENED
ncbi:hypothetical protein Natpe_0913 [Natrinema pellirubrum DSM 15624]|uniref:Halobacterial output domain-containing protein n=1 Tax=Natrinema pellirubrum (strain DSM 15624 / CIP 106293 / JCM 10476 / NCIMB 786 / 157) TaxID=797303 RepID=L0JJ25_NATP1|nr:HalOD1 output domain-containing protein [Natrinema pellirubrum]AGB30828.1 hypothetical protein Natpe_0913 [Natrinema pellirubrum DSM 15624]